MSVKKLLIYDSLAALSGLPISITLANLLGLFLIELGILSI